MSSSNANAKPIATPPSSKPIDVLQSQSSQFYANLHPILLLSILLFSFKSLVEDPVNTLLGLAPTVTILQAVYCVLCLPSTGQTPPPATKPGQKKKAPKQTQDIWSRIVASDLPLTRAHVRPLSSSLYIVVVLFGAPLTTHLPHTILLATHLAVLTTPQLYYAHGLDKETWFRIVSLQLPIDEVWGMTLGACIGAWIGAIPIPLDWDREWQKWPVTIITGLYIGAVVGTLAGGYVFKGWKIKIS